MTFITTVQKYKFNNEYIDERKKAHLLIISKKTNDKAPGDPPKAVVTAKLE